MSDKVDAELPPFSFRKRPIKSMYAPLAMLTIIHSSHFLEKKPDTVNDKPSLNNINYDEQIRAPRMSAATHYTYTPETPVPFTDGNDTSLSRELLKMEEELDETAATSAEQYLPATADINQPTRRSLEPQVSRSRDLLSDDKLTLMRALDNLTSNRTSRERSTGSEISESGTEGGDLSKNNSMGSVTESLTLKSGLPVGGRARAPRGGPGVQQVYDLKKPLCTPAVLRPISDDIDEAVPLDTCLFEVPEIGDNVVPQEPTHSHWQPNSLTDHCMKCFEVFGSFFSPVKRRRHHCRFCGLLFCQNCLYLSPEIHFLDVANLEESENDKSILRAHSQSSLNSSKKSILARTYSLSSLKGMDESVAGVMMDARARLVVPLFRNNPGNLRTRFKQCKLCKSCGQNYQRLVAAMNLHCDVDSPYVFVENPYVAGQQPKIQLDKRVSVPEKRHLLVPSGDWMWSSF